MTSDSNAFKKSTLCEPVAKVQLHNKNVNAVSCLDGKVNYHDIIHVDKRSLLQVCLYQHVLGLICLGRIVSCLFCFVLFCLNISHL